MIFFLYKKHNRNMSCDWDTAVQNMQICQQTVVCAGSWFES